MGGVSLDAVEACLCHLLEGNPPANTDPLAGGVTAEPTEEGFFEQHLVKNVPLVLHDATKGWAAQKLFVDGGAIALGALQETIGDLARPAPVTRCDEDKEEHETTTMKLHDFFTRWAAGETGEYLKDWHWQQAADGSEQYYSVPPCLGSDWLNAYCLARNTHGFGDGTSDYRFVYLGKKGTFTPFHVDVFGTYSWSANLSGKKEWWFIPPEDVLLLGPEPPAFWLRKSAAQENPAWLPGGDETPSAFTVRSPNGRMVRVFRYRQGAGELVFVPSRWGHQVWNLEDCLSINHNWCNACNVTEMCAMLQHEVLFLERQLNDIKDSLDESEEGGYYGHCEWLLRNASNWNVTGFTDFLVFTLQNLRDADDPLSLLGAVQIARCVAAIAAFPRPPSDALRLLTELSSELLESKCAAFPSCASLARDVARLPLSHTQFK